MQSTNPPCKICHSSTNFTGELDANKCCQDRLGGRLLPPSTIMVPYFACSNCGLIFTTYMDHWSPEDFKQKIYNQDYNWINPPIPGRANVPVTETPAYNTGTYIASLFKGAEPDIRILDFGAGGNPGPTGQALLDSGFQLDSYDPYRADAPQPEGRYDVIFAIEVLEHCVDLAAVAAAFKKHAARDAIIIIQTMLHPMPTPDDILSSWYIAPRDGHISIHTEWSLTLLFNNIGMNLVQTARGMFAFRNPPGFPNKLLLPTP